MEWNNVVGLDVKKILRFIKINNYMKYLTIKNNTF